MQRTAVADNYLKAALFKRPDWVPCTAALMPATWMKYRDELEAIALRHPRIFPGHEKGSKDFDAVDDRRYEAGEFTDNWGCRWRNIERGLDAAPAGGPLEDWAALDGYTPPDPLTEGDGWSAPPDWDAIERELADTKARGGVATGSLVHGSMFMRLWYLRGFENLMVDVASGDPRLQQLIDMALDYNMAQIERCLDAGAEQMVFGDDLGFQTLLPIGPEAFRRHFKPCYSRMFGLCRERGALVYLHTDGHVVEIIPDLIECGVQIINPQVKANGLEALAELAKANVCINLDLDCQLFPFATPAELQAHIAEAVEVLNSADGGLMLYAECEPDVPLENIEAICETLEAVGGPSIPGGRL